MCITRNTDLVQSGAIPIGMLTGGLLADFIFESFMQQPPTLLDSVFGNGNGLGMALLFFMPGFIGIVLSIMGAVSRTLKEAESKAESIT